MVSGAWTPADTSSKFNFPKARIWKIAVDGSKSKKITTQKGPFSDATPCWSPDGNRVAFVRIQLKKGEMELFGDPSIYVVDASGGEPELLVSEPGKYVNSLIWSPDGKSIAYLTKEKKMPHTKALNFLDVKSGEVTVAGEVPSVHVNIEMAWSPDCKRIAFNETEEGKVIKIMNLDDGSMEDIETGLVDVTIHHLDWSPDGKRFVFGGMKGGEKEFWLMEDFLPLVKADQ
jgi:Tol biopolymer transport system component